MGPTVIEGQVTAAGMKLGLVVARFNSFIGDRLEAGALDAFARHGGSVSDVTVVRVPGSFEVPGAARLLVKQGKVDAVVCLGAVIRGNTPHFDYVSGEAAKGVGHLAASCDVPVIFGVLTCDTIEQAIDRAGAKHGNKGAEAVVTALEMVGVYRQLQKRR
ncbi:MAG: 6,7-dimethyl-8-ribityllumazine synthase [Deltaproteobacteria bacterium]|nr:6,7-dimethyl-8-ribityllumazine synthase [Deltaproteobacteria bacterium]